jgi:hypothetical protein
VYFRGLIGCPIIHDNDIRGIFQYIPDDLLQSLVIIVRRNNNAAFQLLESLPALFKVGHYLLQESLTVQAKIHFFMI